MKRIIFACKNDDTNSDIERKVKHRSLFTERERFWAH